MSNRKELVQRVNDAFAAGETEKFVELCAEDVEWTMVGHKTAKGKTAIREWLSSPEAADCDPPKIGVDRIVEEGDTVVCYGDMSMSAKGEESRYYYCDIYEFAGDQIKTLRSFMVLLKDS